MVESELSQEVRSEMGMVDHLLEMGTSLYQCRGHQKVLETILSQTRAFSNAEAGSIYLVQNRQLKFVAVQNDTMDISQIQKHLLGKTMPISDDSLAGYAASTREMINIPDSHNLRGAPFRVNRDLDAETGYRVKSILAIPLLCPDGRCVGVLQLFNRLDEAGRPCAFENAVYDRLKLLTTTAAMAVNNAALQDQLRQVHLHTIFRLSTIAEYRDSNTAEHIQRVSRVSELIAEAMGLDSEAVELLKYATPMHDVGKVGIPDAILLKPGHLTAAQRTIMEKHTLYGGEIFGKPEHEILSLARAF